MAKETDADVSIPEKAAHWWILLQSGTATSADHRRFGNWVSRSPERIEAYLRTARLMHTLASPQVRWPDISAETLIREARAALHDDASAASANVIRYPGSPPTASRAALARLAPAAAHGAARPSGFGAGTPRTWGAAAAILATVFAIAWLLLPTRQQYRTLVGEQRYILLEDGSRVTLNTESRIEVELRKHHRLVRLLQGEAMFQVAHDPSRPFDVQAGNAVLRAIGTQFDVDLRANQTTLVVVEGHVAVLPAHGVAPRGPDSRAGSSAAPDIAAAGVARALQVPPGSLVIGAAERVVITPAGVGAAQHLANVAMATSWAQHRLIFDHQPLSQVASEFNRYNRIRIVIDGDALQSQEISGVFQLDDPASFLSFLASLPGVEVHKADDGMHVAASRRR